MIRTSRSGARGFTRIELLLVAAILAIAVGLWTAGLPMVRETAARSQSSNNLRQIGLGLDGMSQQYLGACPPSYGQFKQKVGGFFYHIIPFIVCDNVYKKTPKGGTVDPNGDESNKTYYAPLDDSNPGTGPQTSYACNGAVFLQGRTEYSELPDSGGARYPTIFEKRGSTNLIIVVERYAVTPGAGGQHHWNTNAPSGVRGTTINATSNGVTDTAPAVQFGVPHPAITATTDLTAHAFTASGFLVTLADSSTRLLTPSVNNTIPGGNGVTVFQWACNPGMAGPPPEGW